jgi:hypothetical protein
VRETVETVPEERVDGYPGINSGANEKSTSSVKGTSKTSVPEGRMLSARHESGGKSGKNNNKSRRDGCKFAFLEVPLIKYPNLLSPPLFPEHL